MFLSDPGEPKKTLFPATRGIFVLTNEQIVRFVVHRFEIEPGSFSRLSKEASQ